MVLLRIDRIRIDGSTQARVQTCQEVVEEYAEAKRGGCAFPPIVVFRDTLGRYWLADGFHRVLAWLLCRAKTIEADLRLGELRDAILFAVGTNRKHGLQRTNEDKRKAIDLLLGDAEWALWSNRRIADQCGVSESMVRVRRRDLAAKGAHETHPPARPARRFGELAPREQAELINAEEAQAMQELAAQACLEHVQAAREAIAAYPAFEAVRKALERIDELVTTAAA